MKQLPNILSLGNLFCGVLAIIWILQSPNYIAGFNGQDYLVTAPEPIYWSCWLIAVAALIDFLDGFVARWLQAQSSLGRELDSLADVVSFGVAPGMILYQLLRTAYFQDPDAIEISMLKVAPALLVPCFAAYRLAKFNTDERQNENFIGVPTPAIALLVASFPLIVLHDTLHLAYWLQQVWVLYVIIGALCYAMIANLPLLSLKFKNLQFRNNWPRYALILLTALGLPFLKFAVVPFAFILYIVLSLLANQFSAE